jgi:hypothetical protein
MEKGTHVVNRYWKRMQKYRPGLFAYLTIGKTGYGQSKSTRESGTAFASIAAFRPSYGKKGK